MIFYITVCRDWGKLGTWFWLVFYLFTLLPVSQSDITLAYSKHAESLVIARCTWEMSFVCGFPSVVSTLILLGLMCDIGAILACLFCVSLSVLWTIGEKALMFLVTLATNQ